MSSTRPSNATRGHAAQRISAALLVALASTCAPALAWTPHGDTVAAVKAAAAPSSDPALDDPAWATGTTFADFFDFTNHRAAAKQTTAHLLYDSKNLYFAVHCDQAGIPIVAAQTLDHAGTGTDDHVSLSLETSGSGGRVYRFSVTPRGIRDESDSENARYVPYWQSTAKILPDGSWNAVMVIPLDNIRAQGGEQQSWQVNVTRYIAYTNDVSTWAFDGAMADVMSSQYWPHLSGIQIAGTSARPRPHADFYGLASAGKDGGEFQNGVGDFRSVRPRMYGVDATVPITNTLAFVGTLNPDFSNVEQDQTTIAPQEFQRQYNEYRPFFAQGAGYVTNLPSANVNSADLLFYSPNIGIFTRGLKVEGTQGLSQIGAINVIGNGFNDSVFGYTWNKPDNSLTFAVNGVNANHTQVRDSTFGYGVATTNPHSGLFAIAHLASDRGTLVDTPGQANDQQLALGLQNSRNLAILTYKDIGPQYNPIDGYITLNDVRGPQALYQYTGAGAGHKVKSYILSVGGDRLVDRSGAAHQVDVFSSASVTFTNLVQLEYSQHTSGLRFYDSPYPVYSNPFVVPFNAQKVSFGYKDGTPTPLDASYSWGPFANNQLQPIFLQQSSLSYSRPFGRWGVSFEYDGVLEHGRPDSGAPAIDSQWLRSVAVTRTFAKNASFAVGVRDVSGEGGYATPGTNLSFSFHQRFAGLNELYVDYGTPAATSTLNRWVVKYVVHTGGSSRH
jgi:hypothetical protein